MSFDFSPAALLAHGGITLVILVGLSAWSWVVIIERWLVFRRAEAVSERLAGRVAKLARAGQAAEARALAQAEAGALAQLLHAGLAHGSKDRTVLAEALERRKADLLLVMEARLAVLGTIGSIAPYIGLFGTVLGIIRAFRSPSQGAADAAGAAVVSAGIAEALVATAAGLAVAVPAVVFFNGFNRRLTVLETRMDQGASELVEALTEKGGRKAEADA